MLADKYGMVLINKAASAWEQYCARDKAPMAPRNAPTATHVPGEAGSTVPPRSRPRPAAPSSTVPPPDQMATTAPADQPMTFASRSAEATASTIRPPEPSLDVPALAPAEHEIAPDEASTEAQVDALGVPKEVLQEVEQRIAEMEKHLTDAERALVHKVLDLDDLPHDLVNEVGRVVLMMGPPEAAKYLREAGCLDRARRLVQAAGGEA